MTSLIFKILNEYINEQKNIYGHKKQINGCQIGGGLGGWIKKDARITYKL